MDVINDILPALSLYPDMIGGDPLLTEAIENALENPLQRVDPVDKSVWTYALAALHKGDPQEALDRITKDQGDRRDPQFLLVAALAQYRLGRLADARTSLAEAAARIDYQLDRSKVTSRRHLLSWEPWLRADFLRCKLLALLDESAASSPP